MRIFLVFIALFIAGCATKQSTKNIPDQGSFNTSKSSSLDKDNAPSEVDGLPVIRVSEATRQALLGMWADSLNDRLNFSRFDTNTRNRAIQHITIAGIGPLQCTADEFELLRIEEIEANNEVWIVNLCGEQRVSFDPTGNVERVGKVIVGPTTHSLKK